MGVDGIDKADIFDEYFDDGDKMTEEMKDESTADYITRLKQENQAYKQSEIEAQEIIAELKYKNENLKKEVKQIRTYEESKLSKYKQALEEIREIAYTIDFDICDIQKICNEVLGNEMDR